VFIGHNAVGFASKRYAPNASLGALMLAPMLLDVLWPVFVLAGIEHFRIEPGITAFTPFDFYDYPWSHSLLMAVVWSVLAGVGYWVWRRDGRAAVVIAIGVVSHWVFDFIVHRPDLPLYPGGPKVGLGLWNSVTGTIVVEVALFAAGLAFYRASTRSRDRTGRIGLWSLVVILLVIYAANAASPAPPPNTNVVAGMALATLLFPLWAWWVDRHRTVTK
jgi:membrane-bound metal-dependent hydrolase YbcI (DUF457 family)